jgi:hypothetical protein
MVMVVAGILLLVPAGWLTLVGLSAWIGGPEPIEEARWLKGLFLALSEVGLVGVAVAVGLIAIGVLVWRRSE